MHDTSLQDNRAQIRTPQLVEEVLPDNSPEGGQEKRLARYAKAKARQGLVSDYILQKNSQSEKMNLAKELKALQECGSFLIFRHYFTLGMYKLINGCTCKKHLLCALCAIRRAAKCIAIYAEKINQARAESETDFDEVMITWTIKNGDDLAERYDHLLDSMRKMVHKRRNSLSAKPLTDTQFKYVSGAVYSYEVTYSPEKGFHPHCHMVALIPKGIFDFTSMKIKGKDVDVPLQLKAGLVTDWHQITGDSFIIDVRRIVATEMPAQGEDISGTRLEALVEVFKYALKMNDMNKEADVQENVRIQVEAYEVLKGRRMVGSFGVLWGVKIPENLNDNPLTDAELPFVDLIYQYSGLNFGYELTTHSEVQTVNQLPDNYHGKKLLKKIAVRHKEETKWKAQVQEYVQSVGALSM